MVVIKNWLPFLKTHTHTHKPLSEKKETQKEPPHKVGTS